MPFVHALVKCGCLEHVECDIANAMAYVGRSPKGTWDRPPKIFLG